MADRAIRSYLLICSLPFQASLCVALAQTPIDDSGALAACVVPDYRTPPLVSAGGIYPRCDGDTDPGALAALTDGRGACVCYEGSVGAWVNACRLAARSTLIRIDNALHCPGF